MSRPPINPEKTTAGIIVDPQTLDRVIPESRRPDGSVRKQIKVRPGFTPQEDVQRFRGTKQAQMDANSIPKGHIIGWIPPSATQPVKPMSKSAKKNAKRKEKREEKKEVEPMDKPVRDNWEDDDEADDGDGSNNSGENSGEDTAPKALTTTPAPPTTTTKIRAPPAEHTADKPNETAVVSAKAIQKLTADLKKLNTK